MDQLIYASLSHTHYWYEVDMLKVSAIVYRLLFLTFSVLAVNPSKILILHRVADPCCGLLNRNTYVCIYSNHLALYQVADYYGSTW